MDDVRDRTRGQGVLLLDVEAADATGGEEDLSREAPGQERIAARPALPSTPPGATTYSAEIVDAIGGVGAPPGTPGRVFSDAGHAAPVTVTAFEITRACELFATVITFGLSFHEPVTLVSPFVPALPDDAATTDARVHRGVERLADRVGRRVGGQPAAVAEADVDGVGIVGDDVLDRGEELRRVTVEAVAHDVRTRRHARELQGEVAGPDV